MIVASGFVEVDLLENVENVVEELKNKGLEISEIENNKVVFLMNGDTISLLKAELESLKDIDAIRNVHLAYYSLEDAEESPDIKND